MKTKIILVLLSLLIFTNILYSFQINKKNYKVNYQLVFYNEDTYEAIATLKTKEKSLILIGFYLEEQNMFLLKKEIDITNLNEYMASIVINHYIKNATYKYQ